MPEFFQTLLGRKFYESDVPRIARALEDIASQLEIQNKLKEEELKIEREKLKKG
jgi:hypothetical protein